MRHRACHRGACTPTSDRARARAARSHRRRTRASAAARSTREARAPAARAGRRPRAGPSSANSGEFGPVEPFAPFEPFADACSASACADVGSVVRDGVDLPLHVAITPSPRNANDRFTSYHYYIGGIVVAMKHGTLVAAVAVAALAAAGGTASARRRPQLGKPFEANKTFGLGLMLGEPTGLTGKYFIAPQTAIDFGLGDYNYYRGRSARLRHPRRLPDPSVLVRVDRPVRAAVLRRHRRAPVGLHARRRHPAHALGLGVRGPIGSLVRLRRCPARRRSSSFALVLELLRRLHLQRRPRSRLRGRRSLLVQVAHAR